MNARVTVLNDLLEPVGECLMGDGAKRLVALRAPPSVQVRLDELAAKSSEGTLSKEEREEYETLVSTGTIIAVLQSKARKMLKDGQTPS